MRRARALPQAFEEWYAENKESEELKGNYAAYCFDMEQMGEQPISIKKWARGVYQED